HRAGKRRVRRDAQAGPQLPDESAELLAGRLLAPGTSPSNHLLRQELAARVRPGLARLAERDRAVLVRRYLEQMSTAEGAAGQAGGTAGATAGTLGDFRIVREVGRGGMGVVYEAEQISLGRRVALKVLPFAATMDPRQLARFHNEARAAACLQHPHIVPVYGVGCERGVHFYAMQFVDGTTLAEVIHGR